MLHQHIQQIFSLSKFNMEARSQIKTLAEKSVYLSSPIYNSSRAVVLDIDYFFHIRHFFRGSLDSGYKYLSVGDAEID
jgi:hypothetical protein